MPKGVDFIKKTLEVDQKTYEAAQKMYEAAQKTYEAVQNTSYWFHDIYANFAPNENPSIRRMFSRRVQIILLLMVLVMAELIRPNFLQSLVDLINTIIKELGSKLNPALLKNGPF